MKKMHYDGPIVLVVMDGVGLSLRRSGNAVRQAHTEFLDYAMSKYPNIPLAASGEAVGVMPDQPGNSEVGHITLGTGQIHKQGIAQVEADFKTGAIWDSKAWRDAIKWLKKGTNEFSPSGQTSNSTRKSAQTPAKTPTLHFAGILSDGGAHSHISHLEQMVQRAYDDGVRKIRIHAIFDGRDTPPQSEPKYIDRIEKFCAKFPDADFRIASGAGRMIAVSDRYENDWGMVKLGWDMMVHGKAPREFSSAREAIKVLRSENPRVQDQYLPAFVIVENAAARSPLAARAVKAQRSIKKPTGGATPIGRVTDGDAFIFYDFRADRAVEISRAFTEKDFDKFDRSNKPMNSSRNIKTQAVDGRLRVNVDPSLRHQSKTVANNPMPDIYFAGLTEYDSDRHIPKNTLVSPARINDSLNKFLGQNKVSQLAISETVKFGHITYYFNGKSYKKAPREAHIEIDSDLALANSRPWMKAAEVTDAALAVLDKPRFIRINYPNGDIVGHFAELEPAIVAVEAIDLQLQRLARCVDELGGMMIITADHGNIEEIIHKDGSPRTSHTNNPVPCIFYDNTANAKLYQVTKIKDPGLSNVASTVALLLGLPDYPASWHKPLIKVKDHAR